MSTTLRTLKPGEPIPDFPPTTRTIHTNGYVLLLWRMGKKQLVRTYEHRAVMGNPYGEVHHKNDIKTDNRPENLEVLSARLHRQRHATWDIAAGAELYAQGWSYLRIARHVGVCQSSVFRSLRTHGVVSRPRPKR